jgi:hypothetical protein
MQLKYSKKISKRMITIELETANFTPDENKALDEFGEPVINFQKNYSSKFPVAFEKKVRTGFKVKVRFDGTEDIQAASNAANTFFEEIQEVLSNTMYDLMDKVVDADFSVDTGIVSIQY